LRRPEVRIAETGPVGAQGEGGTETHTRAWLTSIPSGPRSPSGMRAAMRFVFGSIRMTVPPRVEPL